MKDYLCFFIDFVFPSVCVHCSTAILFSSGHVCSECLEAVEKIEKSCPVCDSELNDGLCTVCADREFYPDRNISISKFSGVMKSMISAMKFDGKFSIASQLAGMAATRLESESIDFDMVSFVPMNRKKEAARGYNQSRLIAKGIADIMRKPLFGILSENRESGVQKEYGFNERFFNILGRYSVSGKKDFKERKILLVDDVFTSGATLNECARLLKENGAAAVYTLAAARADFRLE